MSAEPNDTVSRYRLLSGLNKGASDDTKKARLLAEGCMTSSQMNDVSFRIRNCQCCTTSSSPFLVAQLAKRIGFDLNSHYRAMVSKDEIMVLQVLREMILSSEGYEALRALQSSNSATDGILNLIDKVRSYTESRCLVLDA